MVESATLISVRDAESRLVAQSGANITLEDVTIDKLRIHYASCGEGPALLLVHGGTIGWGQWYRNIEGLARRFRVIAVDLPGTGLSSRIDYGTADLHDVLIGSMKRLLDSLGISKAVVVGHSTGAWVALGLALAAPDQVTGLVLSDGVGIGRSVPSSSRILAVPPIKFLLTKISPKAFLTKKYLEAALPPGFVVPDDFRQYVTSSGMLKGSQIPPVLISRFCSLAATNPISFEDRLNQVNVPAAIIWGRNDTIFPFALVKAALKLLPHHNVLMYEDTGHIPNFERPERFNEDIFEFVLKNIGSDSKAIGAAAAT